MERRRRLNAETGGPVIWAAITGIGPVAELVAIAKGAEQRNSARIDPSVTAAARRSAAIITGQIGVEVGLDASQSHEKHDKH